MGGVWVCGCDNLRTNHQTQTKQHRTEAAMAIRSVTGMRRPTKGAPLRHHYGSADVSTLACSTRTRLPQRRQHSMAYVRKRTARNDTVPRQNLS